MESKTGMNSFPVASLDGLLSRSMGKTFRKGSALSVSKGVRVRIKSKMTL